MNSGLNTHLVPPKIFRVLFFKDKIRILDFVVFNHIYPKQCAISNRKLDNECTQFIKYIFNTAVIIYTMETVSICKLLAVNIRDCYRCETVPLNQHTSHSNSWTSLEFLYHIISMVLDMILTNEFNIRKEKTHPNNVCLNHWNSQYVERRMSTDIS